MKKRKEKGKIKKDKGEKGEKEGKGDNRVEKGERGRNGLEIFFPVRGTNGGGVLAPPQCCNIQGTKIKERGDDFLKI